MCLRAPRTWSVGATVYPLYLGSGRSQAGSPCAAIMVLAAVYKRIEEGRQVLKSLDAAAIRCYGSHKESIE